VALGCQVHDSIGLVAVSGADVDSVVVMQAADQACYLAKGDETAGIHVYTDAALQGAEPLPDR